MNPGMHAVVILISCAVLSLCGWRREIAGTASTFAIIALIAAISLGFFMTWTADGMAAVRLTEPVYLFMAVQAFRAGRDGERHEGTALLAGAAACWSGLALHAQQRSALVFIHPAIDVPLGCAVLVSVLQRRPLQQFAALWIGLTLAHILVQISQGMPSLELGSAAFQDRLWIAFALARGISLIYAHASRTIERMTARDE